ncbi:hypothetical protein BRADI_2g26315v3, partial [Brachypodium distachyon]
MTGYRLGGIDMILLPLSTYGFWYLMVANFRKKVFEILHPNNKIDLICDEANTVVRNFKNAFSIANPRAQVNVFDMDTKFRSVSYSIKEADSGIFVLKLIQSHDGDTILCFEPEKAKALREMRTYYLIVHPCNECLMPETKEILSKH